MSTVNASAKSSPVVKIAPSASVKAVLTALSNASKVVKELPPAPAFDASALRLAFSAMQLPEQFIDSAIRESEKKHIATHGDNSERLAKVVLGEIADSLGGLEEFARLASRLASDARAAGKIAITASQFRAALDGDEGASEGHRKVAENASDLRKSGKAWSEIEGALNLSPSTRSALYIISSEYTDLFPVKK